MLKISYFLKKILAFEPDVPYNTSILFIGINIIMLPLANQSIEYGLYWSYNPAYSHEAITRAMVSWCYHKVIEENLCKAVLGWRAIWHFMQRTWWRCSLRCVLLARGYHCFFYRFFKIFISKSQWSHRHGWVVVKLKMIERDHWLIEIYWSIYAALFVQFGMSNCSFLRYLFYIHYDILSIAFTSRLVIQLRNIVWSRPQCSLS